MKMAFCFFLFLMVMTGCVSLPIKREPPPDLTESSSRKKDLRDLIAHYLIDYISLKAGLSVERVQANEVMFIELIAVRDKKEESVFLRASQLKIISEDALFKPLQAELTLELAVVDKNETEIYRKVVTGRYESQKAFVLLEEGAGELAKGVVRDALNQLIQDPELKRVIAKYKYGALGSMASIF